jgi:hypothetical protein
MAAAGAGFGALIRSGVEFNNQLEQARMGLGAMLVANGVLQDMPSALTASARLVEEMRQDADRLPGSFEELLTIVRGSLNSALGVGIDPEHFRRVAGQVLGVSHILGVSAPVAGRETAAMIEGHATRANVLFSRMSGIMRITARDFNQLSGTQRFQLIEKTLSRFDPAMQAYSHSWDAVSSTARDHLRTLQAAITAPIFDAVKGQLERFNAWFEHGDRREQLINWASNFGRHLADGFNRAVELALRLEHLFTRGGLASVIDRLRTAASLGGMARLGLGLAGGGGLGAGLAGFVGGRVLSGLLSGSIDASRALELLQRVARDAEGAFIRLNARLGPVIDSLAQLAIDGFTNFGTQLATAGEALGRFAGSVNRVIDDIRFAGSQMLADNPRLRQGYNALTAGGGAANAFGDTMQQMAIGALPGGQIFGPLVNTAINAYRDRQERLRARNFRPMTDMPEGPIMEFASRQAVDAVNPGHPPPPDRQGPRGTMHVTVRIEQTIHDASDSDRVLIDTHRAIRQALQFPIESATSTSPSLR